MLYPFGCAKSLRLGAVNAISAQYWVISGIFRTLVTFIPKLSCLLRAQIGVIYSCSNWAYPFVPSEADLELSTIRFISKFITKTNVVMKHSGRACDYITKGQWFKTPLVFFSF